MTFSTLPPAYCTNVHAGQTLQQVLTGLDTYTLPVAERFQQPLAAGLWLAHPVVQEIQAMPEGAKRFREELESRNLTCHTLNAFPYGDFHSERVKENVYIPDWTDGRRLEYTQGCTQVLAELLPDDVEGSLSTVPLGFKPFTRRNGFRERAADRLIEFARFLRQLRETRGRTIRLAIEPEPFCLLETTDETLAFFDFLRDRADAAQEGDAVREYIGVCYDVCHQAVEFEDVADSIQRLDAASIRINKVHITCALKVANPAENGDVRSALARYVEPRYLHQTMARRRDGTIARAVDLTRELAETPPEEFRDADEWRVHFHVPVNAESLGPLATTRAELRQALRAVRRLSYGPHLEVETYTWEVLPDGGRVDLVEGLSAEMIATRTLIEELQSQDA